jgi:hypothetical protein
MSWSDEHRLRCGQEQPFDVTTLQEANTSIRIVNNTNRTISVPASVFDRPERDSGGPTFFRSAARGLHVPAKLTPKHTKHEARKRRASERPRVGCCEELGAGPCAACKLSEIANDHGRANGQRKYRESEACAPELRMDGTARSQRGDADQPSDKKARADRECKSSKGETNPCTGLCKHGLTLRSSRLAAVRWPGASAPRAS